YNPSSGVLVVPGCTTNFFPGVIPTDAQGMGGGQAQIAQQFSEQSLLVQHGVIPPPPPKLHTDDWQLAVHFDFTLTNQGTPPIDHFHIARAKFVPPSPPAALADTSVYIKSVSICDPTPFCPTQPPTSWCRVDWNPSSPTYRRVGSWHFPPVAPGAKAP